MSVQETKVPEKMSLAENVDSVLTEIGFGRWQWLVLITSFTLQIGGPVQHLGSTLLSAPVPFRCSYPTSTTLYNLTSNGRLVDDEVEYPSKCFEEKMLTRATQLHQSINSTFSATTLASCPLIEYDRSTFQSTVISEWNLVCEKMPLRPLFQMTYGIGMFIGSIVCGHLSDWLGRKRALQIGSLLTTITVIACSIVPWYGVMIALRILSATGTALMNFPGYTLLSEVSPTKYRTITNMIPGLTHYVGMVIFAGVAYVVPHWRTLNLLCNSSLLIVVPLTFIIDESPRWLLQKGRSAEAVSLLKKAAKQNGVKLSSSTSAALENLRSEHPNSDSSRKRRIMRDSAKGGVENEGIVQMLYNCYKSPGMRIILIVKPLLWFLLRALYAGIAINANNFASSNPFVYVAFSGAMGITAMLLSLPVSHKLPRKVFLEAAFSMSGLLIFLEMIVPSDYWSIKWILVMTAFCCSCGAFQISYIYVAELFPTVIRTRGLTFTSLVGSLGEITIPLVTDIAVQYQWWAASVTFGLSGIISSLLLLVLPETKDKPMPETFKDVEERHKMKHKRQLPQNIDVTAV